MFRDEREWSAGMQKVKSCGFLIFRNHTGKRAKAKRSFLLMRHSNRWDLPKGHVDDGEKNKQCALRELDEETAITAEDIKIDSDFKYSEKYLVSYKNAPGVKKSKKLIIYLAELTRPVDIVVTEHIGYEWVDWKPPHKIQKNTIDPLLEYLAEYWAEQQ